MSEELTEAEKKEQERLMKTISGGGSKQAVFSVKAPAAAATSGPLSPRSAGAKGTPAKKSAPSSGGPAGVLSPRGPAPPPSAASQMEQAVDPLMANKDSDKERKWVNVQIQGLSAWVNSYMTQSKRKGATPIENLAVDFANGVKLNVFVEVLAQKKLRFDETPKMKIQSIQNISSALSFVQNDLQVRLVGIGAEDIYGGNVKLILGLLYSMFRALRLGSLAAELGEGGVKGSEAQQLIAWVQKQVAPAPYELKVADWSDFRDGRAFGALLNLYNKDFLDYSGLGSDGVENLRKAFQGFEEHLKIPQLIDPQEVADGTADERSMTLYTSLIYHAHASAQEQIRMRKEQALTEAELEAQRRAAEEARLRSQQMGGELEHLRGENQKLLERALAAEEMARKALSALDVLRRNLMEHLGDLEHFGELSDIDLDPSKLSVYDAEKVNANLHGKPFDDQVNYMATQLQTQNRTLTRILRVKDSKRDIEDTLFKEAPLYMKTDKKSPWVSAHFRLFSRELAYFSNERGDRQGGIDLTATGSDVTLLKPETGESGEQVFPIKIKLASGAAFYCGALSKHERKVWATLINGRIVHFAYLAACEEDGVRPDLRVVNLCSAPADCPSVYLDNGSLSEVDLKAISDLLPFLEDVNVVSFANTELGDDDIDHISGGLSKASVRIVKVAENELTNAGAAKLADVLAKNRYVTELDVSANQIGDEGATALANMVATNKKLKTVHVRANKIADEGCAQLCKALAAENVPILDFSKNDIGDKGVQAIGDLLRTNATIIEVQLAYNAITDAGVATLCAALKTNTSVLRLHLSHNEIGPAGVQAIHGLLKANKIIRSIDVSGNDNIKEGADLSAALNDGSLSISALTFSRE